MKMTTTSNEIWKDIPGYEECYQVSNFGRVRSLDKILFIDDGKRLPFVKQITGKVLSPGETNAGHLSVVLERGKASSQVHQLVMLAFVGPPPKNTEVRHLDGDPKNNKLENLQYGSRRENILDVYRIGKRWRKLDVKDVRNIKKRLANGEKGASLANEYHVSQSLISGIKRGVHYSWLTEEFY